MTTLSSLLERVKEATGPDRELDRTIWNELVAPTEWMARQWFYLDKTNDSFKKVPPVTASLDASLALVERCLPEWCWQIDNGEPARTERALPSTAILMESTDPNKPEHRAQGNTPPLAVLCALLSALQQEKPDAP